MEKHSVNQSITDNIQSRIGHDVNLVKYISSQLLLSENAVYKRIKGTTPYTVKEVCILAKNLGISVDALIQVNDKNFSYSFQAIGSEKMSPVTYLKNIASDALKLDVDTAKIKYASNEFPIMQYFAFPKLNYFKFYLWSWTNWKHVDLIKEKIVFDGSTQEIQEFLYLSKEIYSQYVSIPSTEYVCFNSLHNTIKQIKYFAEIDAFANPDEPIELCEELDKMIHHLERMAKAGKKFFPGKDPNNDSADFHLYNNEIIQSNNICLLSSSNYNKFFITLDNPNTLEIDNMEFINYVDNWFESMKRFAEPLGKEAEKNRLIYFNMLRSDISSFRQFLDSKN